jgi:hypothetical protein
MRTGPGCLKVAPLPAGKGLEASCSLEVHQLWVERGIGGDLKESFPLGRAIPGLREIGSGPGFVGLRFA